MPEEHPCCAALREILGMRRQVEDHLYQLAKTHPALGDLITEDISKIMAIASRHVDDDEGEGQSGPGSSKVLVPS